MTENPNQSIERKNASRLVFVQALYGEHFGIVIDTPEDWVKRYQDEHLRDDATPEMEADEYSEEVFQLKTEFPPDSQYLRRLLRGWVEEKAAIEVLLTRTLDSKKKPYARLSPLIQSLLCAGAYEIIHGTIKPPVLLKEYIAIAAGFFDNPELGFINGVLQEIANLPRNMIQ